MATATAMLPACADEVTPPPTWDVQLPGGTHAAVFVEYVDYPGSKETVIPLAAEVHTAEARRKVLADQTARHARRERQGAPRDG
jgi:heme exporter protein D